MYAKNAIGFVYNKMRYEMKKIIALVILLLIAILPVKAIAADFPADGRYTVEVTLSGGSGRVKIESPAELTVESGTMTASVIWSSPYYEYMLVDENYYYPVNTDGNSTFEIPVSLDKDMAVSAQTVAMSVPHEIDYTIRFNSDTLKPFNGGGTAEIPFDASVTTVIIVLIIGLFLFIAVKLKQRSIKRNKK